MLNSYTKSWTPPGRLTEADRMKTGNPPDHEDGPMNEPQDSAYSSGFFSDSDADEPEDEKHDSEEPGMSCRRQDPVLSESEISQQVLCSIIHIAPCFG